MAEIDEADEPRFVDQWQTRLGTHVGHGLDQRGG